MKSTTFALAAAAIPLAFAVPFEKRAGNYEVDYVTDLRISTVTTQVTVYYTGQPAAQTALPTPAAPAVALVTETPAAAPEVQSVDAAPAAPAAADVAETPAAPSVEVPSVQTESVSEQPAVQQATTDNTAAAAPAAVQAPAAQSVSSSPAGYGPGPYSVDTGSGTIAAYIGATSGDASYDASSGDFQANILNSTNWWRSQYQAAPLTWDAGLASAALVNSQSCYMSHKDGPTGSGQNLGAGASGPGTVNDWWCNEESVYWQNPADMSNFANWGHFSQVVWQSTTKIGCAASWCGTGKDENGVDRLGWYTVCNYYPAGNFEGEYSANVLPKAS